MSETGNDCSSWLIKAVDKTFTEIKLNIHCCSMRILVSQTYTSRNNAS